jgi:hypothetical protein
MVNATSPLPAARSVPELAVFHEVSRAAGAKGQLRPTTVLRAILPVDPGRRAFPANTCFGWLVYSPRSCWTRPRKDSERATNPRVSYGFKSGFGRTKAVKCLKSWNLSLGICGGAQPPLPDARNQGRSSCAVAREAKPLAMPAYTPRRLAHRTSSTSVSDN